MGQGWWGKGLGRLGIGSSKLASGLTTAQHAAMKGMKSGASKGSGIWNWIKKNPGQTAFLAGGAGLTALPFLGIGLKLSIKYMLSSIDVDISGRFASISLILSFTESIDGIPSFSI